MLPPFIIDQIRQREERERLRQEQSRPRLELPVDDVPADHDPTSKKEDDDAERGVIIVDLMN
jgi:hypothetical protein